MASEGRGEGPRGLQEATPVREVLYQGSPMDPEVCGLRGWVAPSPGSSQEKLHPASGQHLEPLLAQIQAA